MLMSNEGGVKKERKNEKKKETDDVKYCDRTESPDTP